VGAPWPGDGRLGLDELRPWLLAGDPLASPVTVEGSGKAALSLAMHARSQGIEAAVVPDGDVLAPELGLPGRFRLVRAAERAGVAIGPAPTGAGTVIRIGPGVGEPPPRHPEVHVIGDAAGTAGLAAALGAAADVARRL